MFKLIRYIRDVYNSTLAGNSPNNQARSLRWVHRLHSIDQEKKNNLWQITLTITLSSDKQISDKPDNYSK